MKDPCSSVAPLLDKYFDGEASAEEKETVERHLTDCGACKGALESMGRLGVLIRTPVEAAAVEQEAFPWVWQKIQREIQVQPRTTWWESLRARLGPLLFPRRRAWVPAAVAVLILLSVSASFFFRQAPSHKDLSVVEYVESSACNVMVYESDQEKVTVIWLFDCPEKEASSS